MYFYWLYLFLLCWIVCLRLVYPMLPVWFQFLWIVHFWLPLCILWHFFIYIHMYVHCTYKNHIKYHWLTIYIECLFLFLPFHHKNSIDKETAHKKYQLYTPSPLSTNKNQKQMHKIKWVSQPYRPSTIIMSEF